MRRELWETLLELVEAVTPFGDEAGGLRVTSLMLDLPLETQVRQRQGQLVIVADMPRWRWRTDFDMRPGRIRVTFDEGVEL